MAAQDRGALPEELELGHLMGAFGVRGEVKLYLHNPDSDLLARPRDVVLQGPDGSRRTARLRARTGAGRKVIGVVEGVNDRDGAAALTGWRVRIPASALPPPAEDEFYVHQVLGARVESGGVAVGQVHDVHDNGPTTVLEVALAGGRVGYVPMLPTHVLELDVAGRRVVVAAGALAVDEP